MTLRIHDLSLSLYLGVHAWEQVSPRQVSLDLVIEYDAAKAAASDALADALDYDALCQELQAALEGRRIALIEHLASKVLEIVFQSTPATKVEVTVHKQGAVPGADSVSFTMERSRS